MAAPQAKAPEAQPVPKFVKDRVRPDGETVAHALDPDRRTDNVIYRDPVAPRTEDETAPDSFADIEMSRRTDAGPAEAVKPGTESFAPLLWVGAGVALIVLVGFIAL